MILALSLAAEDKNRAGEMLVRGWGSELTQS